MTASIFEYKDYKAYLNAALAAHFQKKRGGRSALARALNCQPGYVSRVLSGNVHFSPEQADLVNQFLGHREDESQYFLFLVEWARAGSTHLRSHLEKQIHHFQNQYLNLKNRLQIRNHLDEKDHITYFSSWHYAAIHTLLSITDYKDKDSIAKRLNIPVKRASEVIGFLIRAGLILPDGKSYKTGVSRLHLGNDSPLITRHHINWRMQAIRSLEKEEQDDLHYSSVVSLSNEDIRKIKNILVKTIESAKAIVRDSKEQTAACFNIDLFEL